MNDSAPAGKDYLFHDDLDLVDPEVSRLIELEDERQVRKIILIASESVCPRAVRQALATSFSNLYAEGYPATRMARSEEKPLLSFDHHLSFFRRYSDRRYYKGCDYINFVESLCKQRAAELFATDRFDGPGPRVPASDIYVNVQPLSGAAANNAVYNAFVEPGETVMGLNLSAGGHLTHGSPVNRSGKNFNIVPYTIDRTTGRLDYDRIKDLAREHRPKMIIAGFSAYPWSIDWPALKEAARAAGGDCILLADVSHPAGLIVAGGFPSPIGIADVTMTTTHKTLCGPRGAVLMTTDPARAKAIEMGVFPGEQGGPHINSILAKAVAFRIALTGEFQTLQRKIKENAAYLAEAVKKRGLELAYGGTDSHLFLIDLNCIEGPMKDALRGETASRILDLCDITLNKNTIAGDTNANHPSGIRIGTTWVTQRGFGPEQLDRLAELIHKTLTAIEPFHYIGSGADLCRGKIDYRVMEEVKEGVRDLLESAAPAYPEKRPLYPFYSVTAKERASSLQAEIEKSGARKDKVDGVQAALSFGDPAAEAEALEKGCGLADLSQTPLLEVSGERAAAFLQNVLTVDAVALDPGRVRRGFLLDSSGKLISDATLFRLEKDDAGFDRYFLALDTLKGAAAVSWLRGLSDGYITLDEEDIFRKAEGPVVIKDLRRPEKPEEQRVRLALLGPRAGEVLGEIFPETEELEEGSGAVVDRGGTRLAVTRHGKILGSGGYELYVHPLQAKGLWRHILAEAGGAVRPVGFAALKEAAAAAGRPFGGNNPPGAVSLLEGAPEAFDFGKPWFIGRKVLPGTAAGREDALPLPEYEWTPPEGPLKRTPLYDIHRKLTRKDFLIPFAGWEMPVWYTRVSEEHRAVRTAAGLFDVAHMGVMDFSGPLAARFLDFCTTNYATSMADGQARYSYLLGPDGEVLDDIMIYRLSRDRFMVVCNAANEDKVLAWFRAVASRKVLVSRETPAVRFEGEVAVRDLKDPSSGDARKIDLAFQGPKSMEVLLKLVKDGAMKSRLAALGRSNLTAVEIDGIDVIASRTGYTGEEFGFELFVHPDRAADLWSLILDAGRPAGVAPTGLGARDSTRCEAGLPLYGHELAGKYDIDPIEAGYGYFVKFHKPFFIGREALLRRWLNPRKKEIVRFRVTTKMPRTVKPGDPVADRSGRFIGNVTSCVLVEGKQIGQALVDSSFAKVNTRIAIFPLPPGGKAPAAVALDKAKKGDRLVVSERAKVISRFPMRK